MDDIDLDVMFAADGDALFDGLDIDLDMDDITGGAGGGGSSSGALDASNKSNPSSFNRRMASRPPPQTLSTAPGSEKGEDELSRTRRKTKRKAKTPSFFEDDDDDYDDGPANKKKRKASGISKVTATNATTLAKKKSAAKITQDDMPTNIVKQPPAIPKAKSKSTKASSTGMPPPLARTGPWVPASSSSNGAQHVAASGQFGNRPKQRPSGTSFPSLPKGGGTPAAGVGSSNQGVRMMNKLPLARSASEACTKSKSSTQQLQKRLILPQESTYCGLQPSPTQFYPFMPALPTEPVLKSRKIYGSIDRIHTSLVGYLHTPPTASSGIVQAKENEPVFHLLQEAFKEEKSSAASLRLESIGVSIGELRQTINSMDKNRIISDWYGVCALIKRQHDFLKQNCENMERWCRDNFSKEDFAEVFAPSKKRKETDGATTSSILKTFTKREIKVKISFTGLKDPKMPAFVLAVFPPLFLPNEVTIAEETETKQISVTKKKAHIPSSSTLLHDGRTSELLSPSSKIKPPQPLSYANMKPPRRRRNVAEMIARTARELSKVHSMKIEMTRKTIDRREAELQKVLSQDGTCGMNTTAMWKWVEVSEFFNDYTAEDVEDSLQDIRPIIMPCSDDGKRAIRDDRMHTFFHSGEGVEDILDDTTAYERLQSLLVDVQSQSQDDENDCCTEMMELANEAIDEICSITDFIDVSSFTLEERSCIVLRGFGFTNVFEAENTSHPLVRADFGSGKRCNGYDHNLGQNGKDRQVASAEEKSDDLDDVVAAMKSELDHVEELNDYRVTYLESASFHYGQLRKDRMQQSERDVGLISKCQQLMRKSKELKAKSGATIRKDDSLALPW